MPRKLRAIFFLFVFSVIAGGSLIHAASAQTVTGDDVDRRKAQLEKELAEYEQAIAEQQKLLDLKKSERVTLERDVSILDAQIKKSQLAIAARALSIQKLRGEIGEREKTIGSLNAKLDREKQSLSQLLRRTNEIDDYALVEMVLGNGSVSDFFQDLDTYSTIKEALADSFVVIGKTKENTEAEKTALLDRQDEEQQLKTVQELEKQKIQGKQTEKKQVLTVTKGQETEYQKVLAAQQKRAAEIRSELFRLRGSAAIPFGKALEYANFAAQKTGLRPAFILGIVAEESNLGENVGTGNWKTDMHPTRDQWIFEVLMKDLGLNPDSMQVSAKPSYGWGGAMGPAQFIPSTWALYAGYDCSQATKTCAPYNKSDDRIGNLAGETPPNPWTPPTAFIASGILLADNGASAKTFAAERLAALRYFAGWGNASKPAFAFYGDDVMELAAKYQGYIDSLAAASQ